MGVNLGIAESKIYVLAEVRVWFRIKAQVLVSFTEVSNDAEGKDLRDRKGGFV
jgi:hypothetical protein